MHALLNWDIMAGNVLHADSPNDFPVGTKMISDLPHIPTAAFIPRSPKVDEWVERIPDNGVVQDITSQLCVPALHVPWRLVQRIPEVSSEINPLPENEVGTLFEK